MKLKDEKASVRNMLSHIENPIIKERLENLLLWDIDKAAYYRKVYYAVSIGIIVINGSIPVINQIAMTRAISLTVSALSAIASILAGILTLVNVKDNWFRYRKYAELMKTECSLFINQCPPYDDKANRECHFIRRIEAITSEEREHWELSKFKNNSNEANNQKQNTKD